MRPRLLVLILIAAVAGASGAQQSQSLPAEAGPPLSGTPRERIEWVKSNPGSAAVASVLGSLIADAMSVDDLIPVRDLTLRTVENSALRYSAAISLAPVFRTARRLDSAEALYAAAYESSGRTDLHSLLSHAQLLVERGELDEADAQARYIVLAEAADYSLKRRAYTLSARIAYERGQHERALEMLSTLASLADEEGGGGLVELETLLLMQQVAANSGEAAQAADAGEMLARLFPSSVGARIVTGQSREMASAGLPSLLLFASSEATAESAWASPATSGEQDVRRDQPMLTAIQVGSFRDQDNATHLAADLSKLGLDARVDDASREGRTLHQVVVTIPNGDPEAAASILATLSDAGYDGFLVY